MVDADGNSSVPGLDRQEPDPRLGTGDLLAIVAVVALLAFGLRAVSAQHGNVGPKVWSWLVATVRQTSPNTLGVDSIALEKPANDERRVGSERLDRAPSPTRVHASHRRRHARALQMAARHRARRASELQRRLDESEIGVVALEDRADHASSEKTPAVGTKTE